MNAYESNGQETGESTDEQRAEWERFTMVVLDGDGGGHINVRNDSHDNPNEHIHTVHVANGHADGCTCPHALYRDAHCKHQRAVEHRPLVLSSADAANASTSASASPATTSRQVATDGGTVSETPEETHHDRPQTDQWGQPVEHYDDGPVGAGEKSECQSCGARFEIALIAATAETSEQWEEFYECQHCGARGSFRVDETRFSRETQRTWTGRVSYPDE